MTYSYWRKFENFIIVSAYLRFVVPPDSSSGENNVSSESSPPPPPPPPSTSPDLQPPPVTHRANDSMGIQIGPSSTASTAGGEALPVDTDFKREGKMAYTATLGLIAISVTLMLNIPQPIEPSWCTLHACEAAFACSSLILSIGLAFYSIVNPVGEKLARVQVRGAACSGLLVIFAVLFHLAATLPLFYFLIVLPFIVVVIGSVILYLYSVRAKDKKTQ